MLNVVYRLISPKRIEANFTDIQLDTGGVIVRPTYLSICHADQRYFQGERDTNILKEKLPMALIHEAIGTVIYDSDGGFKSGERVILIPNLSFEKDEIISENYLRSSRFRASSCDGFMQEHVKMERDRLIKVPQEVSDEMGAFTEIISVCVHTIMRFDKFSHERRNVIGIWGDGNLGYIVAAILSELFPSSILCIMGLHHHGVQRHRGPL